MVRMLIEDDQQDHQIVPGGIQQQMPWRSMGLDRFETHGIQRFNGQALGVGITPRPGLGQVAVVPIHDLGPRAILIADDGGRQVDDRSDCQEERNPLHELTLKS